MSEPEIYFGAPGGLVTIPQPRGGVQTTRVRQSSTFTTGTGGARTGRTLDGKRRYTLNWQQLWYETFAAIYAYDQGHNGPGPFVLHDPSQINWLTVNQSAATSHRNNTDGFTLSATSTTVTDNFTRTVTGGWGTASPTGSVWTTVGGAAANYFTSLNEGFQENTSNNVLLACVQATGGSDMEVDVTTRWNYVGAATAAISTWVAGRYTDINNFYYGILQLQTDATVTLGLYKRVGGVDTTLVSPTVVQTGHTAAQYRRVKVKTIGTAIAVKTWLDGTTEPSTYLLEATDSSLTTGANAACLSRFETGNTNSPKDARFDNFTVSLVGSAITSSSVLVNRGPRSLVWTHTGVGVTVPILGLDSPSPTWPGIPVIAGQAVVFSATARGGGADPIATITPQLVWLDSAGAVVSTTSGTPVVTASGAWAAVGVTATPPATAYYVLCKIEGTSGATIGTIVYLDKFQLERGSTATTWRPGTGIFPVTVLSLNEQYPWQASTYRESPVLVLQETGA